MTARQLFHCATALFASGVAHAESAPTPSTIEQPWDQSVRLEKQGDLRGAEAILVAAWGKRPDNFYAQLRLAYLALVAKRANAAVARYARARQFPEAASDTDVDAGYAAALVLKGWRLADAGRTSEAQACWRQALAVQPDQVDAKAGLESLALPMTEPDLWGALVGQSLGSGRYQGTVLFAQVPWRFFDRLTLRAAARHIAWRQISAPTPWVPSGTTQASWSVNEIYGGAGYDTPLASAEALGFAVTSTGSSTLSGTGLRLRAGRTWGASADATALRTDGAWTNEQAQALAFVAPEPHLALHAGARLTHEPGHNWPSALAGASLWAGPLALYLQGHVGTEYWSANLASPSILYIAPRTRAGGTVTLFWNATRVLRVAGQVEADTLVADGATGWFWAASLGLQLRIFSL
jgi:tetratricopeptide (TPR) repeat protein